MVLSPTEPEYIYPLNQRLEVREAPLTIIPKNTLAEIFTTHSATMSSSGLDILVSNGEVLVSKDMMVPLIWKMRLPLGYLEIFMLNQQARGKKRAALQAGVINHNYQWEIVLPPT